MGSFRRLNRCYSKSVEDDPSFANILLLGETGVGKTTFINSFANYLTYPDFATASKNKLEILTPVNISVYDENVGLEEISLDEDKNQEFHSSCHPSTQFPKSYVFPYYNDRKIRLIDTPGGTHYEESEEDSKLIQNCLDFISHFDSLTGIIILLHADNSKLISFYKNCIRNILINLGKNAAKNLIFLFTHSRGCFFKPGEGHRNIRKIVRDLEIEFKIEIPFIYRNIFIMDNESFRYLVAIKNKIKVDKNIIQNLEQSWDASDKECGRLINYVIGNEDSPGLVAVKMKGSLSINDTRRILAYIYKPLIDIYQLIYINKSCINSSIEKLKYRQSKVGTLEKVLCPKINYKATQLPSSTIFCTAERCSRVIKVSNKTLLEYHQECHSSYYARNFSFDLIGDSELLKSPVMNLETKTCKECRCDYKIHMHSYYQVQFHQLEEEIELNGEPMRYYQKKLEEYNDEMKEVANALVYITHFLKENDLAKYENALAKYVSLTSKNDFTYELLHHMNLLEGQQKNIDKISPQKIIELQGKLFKMKNVGSTLRNLFDLQQDGLSREVLNREKYYHFNQNGSMERWSSCIVERIEILESLLPYAMGENDKNLKAMENLPGITKVKREGNVVILVGNNEDSIMKAVQYFDIKRVRFYISKELYDNNDFLSSTKRSYGLHDIIKNRHVVEPMVWLIGHMDKIEAVKKYLTSFCDQKSNRK